jgi:hypothetical protein
VGPLPRVNLRAVHIRDEICRCSRSVPQNGLRGLDTRLAARAATRPPKYRSPGGRVASASERIETTRATFGSISRPGYEVSIRGSQREQLLDHRNG